nr:nucleoside-diphosphate sugar epimerase/dehydratase [Thermovirga lienii]
MPNILKWQVEQRQIKPKAAGNLNGAARIIILILIDSLLIAAALMTGLLLRFEGDIPGQYVSAFRYLLPYYILVNIICFYLGRLYHRMWRYASIRELYGLLKAATAGAVIMVVLIYALGFPTLPRSVYILSWFFIIAFVGSSRLGWRLVRDMMLANRNSPSSRVLIIGAGDAGAMVAREIMNNRKLNLEAVGFIDDNPMKQKLSIYGIPVLGTREAIPRIVREYHIDEIIIAMPSAGGRTIREINQICRQIGAKARIFQGADTLLGRKYRIKEIELDDLLKREPVKLNLDEIAGYLKDKTVLVSGAGGSIGSELCRQIAVNKPKRLILLDCSENDLFEIENELRENLPALDIVPELADIRDKERLIHIFGTCRPQVVFHAAAYKHVPMMEKHPLEAVKNNIFGTRNLAEAADRFQSETFILISTDKAVNPSNVMGATKRAAELIIQEMNHKSQTTFAAVRFGNVLGSRGSVVPIFRKQIEKGGPVTVTHPEMTRYFMTIPEAVQLVIQAGAMAMGGEIFVLDMGEPVRIMDLAYDMIRLVGYQPGEDIEIKITGIRPGEKLHEELFAAREQIEATRHERIFLCHLPPQNLNILNMIDEWEKTITRARRLDRKAVMDFIHSLIPEFQAAGEVAAADERKEAEGRKWGMG